MPTEHAYLDASKRACECLRMRGNGRNERTNGEARIRRIDIPLRNAYTRVCRFADFRCGFGSYPQAEIAANCRICASDAKARGATAA